MNQSELKKIRRATSKLEKYFVYVYTGHPGRPRKVHINDVEKLECDIVKIVGLEKFGLYYENRALKKIVPDLPMIMVNLPQETIEAIPPLEEEKKKPSDLEEEKLPPIRPPGSPRISIQEASSPESSACPQQDLRDLEEIATDRFKVKKVGFSIVRKLQFHPTVTLPPPVEFTTDSVHDALLEVPLCARIALSVRNNPQLPSLKEDYCDLNLVREMQEIQSIQKPFFKVFLKKQMNLSAEAYHLVHGYAPLKPGKIHFIFFDQLDCHTYSGYMSPHQAFRLVLNNRAPGMINHSYDDEIKPAGRAVLYTSDLDAFEVNYDRDTHGIQSVYMLKSIDLKLKDEPKTLLKWLRQQHPPTTQWAPVMRRVPT